MIQALEPHVHIRRFFVANQIGNAYKKIAEFTKPFILELLEKAPAQVLYYTFDLDDQADAPEVITSGNPFKCIKSGKTTRRFRRPSEVPGLKLSAKQLAAICSFDAKLVDAAALSGVISAGQLAGISLESDFSEFPLVQAVK